MRAPAAQSAPIRVVATLVEAAPLARRGWRLVGGRLRAGKWMLVLRLERIKAQAVNSEERDGL